MNLIARLKGMLRSADEKHAEETLEARAAGVDHPAEGIGPGMDAEIDRMAEKLEHAEEHQEPR